MPSRTRNVQKMTGRNETRSDRVRRNVRRLGLPRAQKSGDGRLVRPRIDGRTVARTAVAVSIGVGAASGCHPKRAEVDKTTGVTRAPAARVPALRAADAGKSAARPDVMCSAKRGGMDTSNVTTAFFGLLVRSRCAGRYPGGQREHCAGKNKPSHHSLLRVPGHEKRGQRTEKRGQS